VAAGCKGCHVEAGESVAPSLRGLYGGEVQLEGGVTVVADEEYLRESILSPGAKLVEGYREIMPEFQGLLTEDQVDALIAYLRTLAD
jgi:cytochrome c oxidase subunit 2